MDSLLFVLGSLALVAGLINVIYPIRALKIETRKTAAFVAFGGLLLLIVGGAIADTASPDAAEPLAPQVSAQTRADTGALQADLQAAERRVSDLESTLAEVEVEKSAALEDVSTLKVEKAGLDSLVAELTRTGDQLSVELVTAQQLSEELLLKYDPEIRAALEAAYAEEVSQACEAAKIDIDANIASLVTWSDDWEAIGTRQGLVDAVTDCSAADRAKTADQREADRLAACETVEPGQLEKNPGFYEGTCVVVYALVAQWDANTGSCAFHAEISATRSTRWYDYDVRTTFGTTTDEALSSIVTDCPELADFDNGDYLKVWATGLGSYSYSTSMGGTNTIPSFQLVKVELVKKDD